ncbi:MAG: valine--tRNA ligase [Actinomycetota bacterium]|nr:valine--tRNA ligase [Actinomycetota bacterium]
MANKRTLDTDLPPAYEPSGIEEHWYKYWEEKGYFHANPDSGNPPFSMVIPPPNITGVLHMGHALNNTLQDIIARRKRMEGYEVLWIPGTDHAGIATQNVVERNLKNEGTSRQEIGREAFIERVWEWKKEYGGTIIRQLKRLGCSCDWKRERFTMDEGCSLAVRTVFKRLYDEGLIYRGKYIINWCPRCHTALSDVEVEHEEKSGHLWYIRYPFEDGEGHISVATTRPETMLGDVAVAVSPEDERYLISVGRTVILPLVGRRIPVIRDEFVDPNFGTGAVKVTPAHDPNDFEIGIRHKLEQINVMTEDGRINENGGRYSGLDRYDARKAVLEGLRREGLLEKVEDYDHAVGRCYRCGTEIEPYLSTQWFVKAKPLAAPAIEAVKVGRTVFIPKRWEKVYFEWMENIRDWCISRQLWWGHRIPVWYCKKCGRELVEIEEPERCPCGSVEIEQDSDVLDTWFSSGLWPFSTMGWPENTRELEVFYPTSVLTTGFDIIFFWVARMMMLGLHCMGDVPFREVFVTALVRDYEGKKMSKSSGNIIDPIDIIEKYGCDALRLTLASIAVPGRDINLSEERIEGSRNFANKVWNAARLVLSNTTDFDSHETEFDADALDISDRWILSRMRSAVGAVRNALDRYNMSVACKSIHEFFWGEFCDWYLEIAKPRFYKGSKEERQKAQWVSLRVLECSLKLLHPFMPFITEELWQQMPGSGESIMISSVPRESEFAFDGEAEKTMEIIKSAVTGIRSARSEHGISPSIKISVSIVCDERNKKALKENSSYIMSLAGIEELSFPNSTPTGDFDVRVVAEGGIEAYISTGRGLARSEEIERLKKKLRKAVVELERVSSKLENPEFVKKAPVEIVEKEKRKSSELLEQKRKLLEQIAALGGD